MYQKERVWTVGYNGTLYPILETGVQDTRMEVSVTSVLK